MISREILDRAVLDVLEAQTSKKGNIGQPPDWNGADPDLPHFILYPFNSGPGEGSWEDPEEDRWFVYQVTSVGIDGRQAAWMSDRIREVFLNRKAGGGYSVDIPVTGADVQDRASIQLGAILPAGELFNVQDTSMVKAGPA